MTDDIEQVKADFDLIDRLRGRRMRSGRITIYTDEPTADELGGAYDLKNGFGVLEGRERWGVLGEIDAIEAEDENKREAGWKTKVNGLKKRAKELRAKLDESAIIFHLEAVPPVIIELEFKAAQKPFRDKQTKKIPADRSQEATNAALNAVYSKIIRKIETPDGGLKTDITVKDTEALRDYLPKQEYQRLQAKIDDIQERAVIDSSVVDDSDF